MRKASGLVRDVSASSAMMWNLVFLNLAFGSYVVWEWGLFVAPNANIYVASIIAMIGAICVSVVYGLFVSAMPRSGGDYVFTSRNLHPALGFTISWSYAIWAFFLIGGSGYISSVSAVPFMFNILGFTAAQTLISPTWTFVVTMTMIVIAFIILSFGMRVYMKLTWIIFIFGIAMAAVVIGLFMFSSQTTFANNFNSNAGSATAYQEVVANAASEGFVKGNWAKDTFMGILPILYWPIGWGGVGAAYFAGEIKDAQKIRSSLYFMCTAPIIMTVFILLVTFGIEKTVGMEWLSSLVYLFMTGSAKYPVAFEPHFGYLASVLTQNMALRFIIGLSWVLFGFNMVIASFIIPVRYMFAWSFDRLLPTRVAYVHPRLHSPILANLICLIVGILFFWLVYFSGLPWVGTISLVIGNSTTGIIIGFAICVLAGTLLPYLRKNFFERSNINIKIGGIAVITLAGIIALVYMVWSDAMFMTYAPLGTNQLLPLVFTLIVTFSGVPIYYLIRYINKTRGVDVDLLFREIPPA